MQQLLNHLVEFQNHCVIPLYVLERRKLQTQGSAVVVQTAENHVIVVTAGHVIDAIDRRAIFTWGNTEHGLIQLRGDGFTSEPAHPRRHEDRVDLAGFSVDGDIAKQLIEADVSFTRASRLVDAVPDDAILAFAGYPLTANKFRVEREDGVRVSVIPHMLAVIYAKPAGRNGYLRTKADSILNLVAEFDHQRARDASGLQPGFPHPRGMSGGAIFCITRSPRSGALPAIGLAGIGTEYHERAGLLVGSNARAVRRLLEAFA